jgi:predicted dehydrogenase
MPGGPAGTGDDMMNRKIARRKFLEVSTAAAAGLTLSSSALSGDASQSDKPVRVGVVGVGNRGTSLLRVLLSMKGVEVPAICDIDLEHLQRATDMVAKAGRKTPEGYSDGEEQAFKSLMDRDDLDAVVIATPWEWHTPMAVYGMRAGKYVGVEVPAAITMEECWELVNTHEETNVPCMMLENWSFRRDNLAVLNMIRQGLFGEIVHCHCAHSHDCIDHWFFDRQGNDRWPAKYLIERNADQYPTHSLGPVISWMDINCGDYFASVTSTATESLGINAHFTRKFGPDHPGARRQYAQGDIVTSVVKTHRGRTIVINYDMQLPRPYDNRWMIQGTLGIYNEQRDSVHLVDRTPKYHQWEPFAPYQKEFEHPWWKTLGDTGRKYGHGGTDYLEMDQFLKAVRYKMQTPIDVYDSVIMSVIVPLSERSIAAGGAPVDCPDFTRGAWKTNKPTFAVET